MMMLRMTMLEETPTTVEEQGCLHAEVSGLRRILYRHPWFSTVVGVSSNMVILSIIILISWTTFFAESSRPLVAGESGLEGEVDESDEGDVGDVDQPAIED